MICGCGEVCGKWKKIKLRLHCEKSNKFAKRLAIFPVLHIIDCEISNKRRSVDDQRAAYYKINYPDTDRNNTGDTKWHVLLFPAIFTTVKVPLKH